MKPTPCVPVPMALVTALLLLCASHQIDGKLLMVYYMHRHGARNVLPKSSVLTENNATGGPALLPAGYMQLQEAGIAFRARYIDVSTCEKTSTCLGEGFDEYGIYGGERIGYHNYNTLIRSSGLDRTIASAGAFTSGLFPLPSNMSQPDLLQAVPVFSSQDANDGLIRAYTKCPTYNKRLMDWYTSSEFKTKESESAALRNKIGGLNPQLNVSLSNWWNVFDVYNTVQRFGFGGPLPILDNATFEQVVQLASWLESTKMQHRFTGNLLGGPLVADLLKYLDAAANAPAGGMYYKLVGISAHYNTLMATAAALKLGEGPTASSYPFTTKIPEMGAIMVYELYADDQGNKAVRLVVQNGAGQPYTTIAMPCSKAGSAAESVAGPGSCSYSDFVSMAKPEALGTPATWCSACKHNDTAACQLYWSSTNEQQLQSQVAAYKEDGFNLSRDEKVVIAVLAIIAGLALVAVVVLGVMLKQRTKADNSYEAATPMYMAGA